MLVDRVVITPGGVALPQFDQRPRHRPSVLVEHMPGHDDALAERLALVLPGQIGHVRPGPDIGEIRPGHLGQRMLEPDRRPVRRALLRALVIGVEIGRRRARTRPGEGQEFGGHHRHSRCHSDRERPAAWPGRLDCPRTRPLRSIPQRGRSPCLGARTVSSAPRAAPERRLRQMPRTRKQARDAGRPVAARRRASYVRPALCPTVPRGEPCASGSIPRRSP